MPYMNERLMVALANYTIRMDILPSLVPQIFLQMIEPYYSDRVICQFSYKQHIRVDIDTSDVQHAITRQGKHNDYDQLSHHEAYVSQQDAQRNEIFTDMHLIIINEKYLMWYMSITYRVITLNPDQVPSPEYMQYKQHAQWIQNIISNLIFFNQYMLNNKFYV